MHGHIGSPVLQFGVCALGPVEETPQHPLHLAGLSHWLGSVPACRLNFSSAQLSNTHNPFQGHSYNLLKTRLCYTDAQEVCQHKFMVSASANGSNRPSQASWGVDGWQQYFYICRGLVASIISIGT